MASSRSVIGWVVLVLVGVPLVGFVLVRGGLVEPGPLLEVVGFDRHPDVAAYTFGVTWEGEPDWVALGTHMAEVEGCTRVIVEQDAAEVRWEGRPEVIGDDWQAHVDVLLAAAPEGAALDARAVRFSTGRYTMGANTEVQRARAAAHEAELAAREERGDAAVYEPGAGEGGDAPGDAAGGASAGGGDAAPASGAEAGPDDAADEDG